MTADDILDALRREFPNRRRRSARRQRPSRHVDGPGHHTPGGELGLIGVIALITRPFYGDYDSTCLMPTG